MLWCMQRLRRRLLCLLCPRHRQEEGQCRARHRDSEYDIAALAGAVTKQPDVPWRPLRCRSCRGVQGGRCGAIAVSVVAYAAAAR